MQDMHENARDSDRIEFRGNESRLESVFYIGFGGFIVYHVLSLGGWTAIVGGVFFGALFLLLAAVKVFSEPDRQVYLAFDVEGLLAPHVVSRKLPWSAIKGYSLFPGTESEGSLFVKVDEIRAFEPISKNPLELWPISPGGFRVQLHKLDCGPDDIDAAFQRFAPSIPRT